mmetsp:Transcript_4442/g.11663  ORF Transcript_4442/g.11663 Transcript_4442/m.11663 type:complete len:260 (-) Transcript_4442:196-975(-)
MMQTLAPRQGRIRVRRWTVVCSIVLRCFGDSKVVSSLTQPIVTQKELVKAQLGYIPSNFVKVSAWKRRPEGMRDVPVAIQTYPLHGGAKRRQAKALETFGAPFPTLYWLTCPDISKAIGTLEGAGCIGTFEQQLRTDDELTQRMLRCHKSYAQTRWNSLRDDDRELLLLDVEHSRIRSMLQDSGISGLNYASQISDDGIYTPTIKCLHTHYAHYRSQMAEGDAVTQANGGGNEKETTALNPVGEMVHRRLEEQFPDLVL